MSEVAVREMTSEEFDSWIAETVKGYAASQAEAGAWPAGDAERLAAEQTRAKLPRGVETPGMAFLTAALRDGRAAGFVWLALTDPPRPGAWIYQIEVLEPYRGRGYSRALLAAAEQRVRDSGVASLGLNVFAGNGTARRLYESSGYETTSLQMRKMLTPQA